jgi:large subunit ribosomal protein L9
MKLLLQRDVPRLGIVGDVVEVSSGYARNYLIPHHIAVEPTKANMKAIEEARRIALEERRLRREALEVTAARLREVEVTIAAAANPEGHLYGSVGPREIAAALRDLGHSVEAEHVQLHTPIRELDSVSVDVKFADDLKAAVKVWVVRESAAGDLEVAEQEGSRGDDDLGTDADDERDGAS